MLLTPIFKRLAFILADPAADDLILAKTLINEKDAPIIAAVITSKVDWLLSLDSHFLNKDWEGKLGFSTSTPGDFLQKLAFGQD
ncbi:MAG: hypothetical protein KGZ57_06710 [Dethiobacter sp.]|nr:hypothetical protein [Dethiobacter sp.]